MRTFWNICIGKSKQNLRKTFTSLKTSLARSYLEIVKVVLRRDTPNRQCNNNFLLVSGFIGSGARNGSCPLVCISVMPEYCDHREIKFLPTVVPLEVFNLTHRVVNWDWWATIPLSLVTPHYHYQLLVLVYPEEAVEVVNLASKQIIISSFLLLPTPKLS